MPAGADSQYRMRTSGRRAEDESFTSGAERSVSPVVGTVLMVGIVVILAALASVAVLGFAGSAEDAGPTASLDVAFEANSDIDPHWTVNVTHEGGEPVGSDELLVRFVDDYDESQADVLYPGRLTAGDRFRAELWGDHTRASDAKCLAAPESDIADQLDGHTTAGQHATEVEVLLIHEPSNELLAEETVDLGEESDRFTGTQRHYLVDGVTPSVDCPNVLEQNW